MISQFSSIYSISFHISTSLSSILSISYHYSTYFSSISFHISSIFFISFYNKIWKIEKKIVKRWKIWKKSRLNSVWYEKYGRKVSWNVKWYGKYGSKVSWNASIISKSFHNFLLYFPNLFTIQLAFLSYFLSHFTFQLAFLPYHFIVKLNSEMIWKIWKKSKWKTYGGNAS
jgi:hypothetical protein